MAMVQEIRKPLIHFYHAPQADRRLLREVELGMEEEGAEAYKRLIQIEKDPERLAAARERELELQELKSEEGKDAP